MTAIQTFLSDPLYWILWGCLGLTGSCLMMLRACYGKDYEVKGKDLAMWTLCFLAGAGGFVSALVPWMLDDEKVLFILKGWRKR